MKSNRNLIYFLRNLREKHRLSLRNEHNDSEVWYMHISPVEIIGGSVALVLILFILILTTVAYTPILDLIPGYPGNRSREMLIQNIMRLDSLERQLNDLQVYSRNVSLIMEGKTPVLSNSGGGSDSVLVSQPARVPPSAADSALRRQLEGTGIYHLNTPVSTRRNVRSGMELFTPVKGVVAGHFNPKESRFGVSIATAVSQQVQAVEGGTVTLSTWSPGDGYILQIQHPNNLISVYKHSSQALKPVGSRVKAGEVIGYTGEGLSGEGGKGLFEFELWQNGSPVDPETYIVF